MDGLDTPIIEDFYAGVVREQAYQEKRWGSVHDRNKAPADWFWLVGYLAGKALASAITGNREKALHHCISSAAVQVGAVTHERKPEAAEGTEVRADVLRVRGGSSHTSRHHVPPHPQRHVTSSTRAPLPHTGPPQ